MADLVTNESGTITVAGNLNCKKDLMVADVATIGENLIIAGDVRIEDDVTETAATSKFALQIPSIPLTSGAHCYSVAPCDLAVIGMYAVLVEVIDSVTGDAPKITLSVGGTPDAETLLVGTAASSSGDVFAIAFATPSEATKLDVLLVESNGTADSTGIVDVTLICEG